MLWRKIAWVLNVVSCIKNACHHFLYSSLCFDQGKQSCPGASCFIAKYFCMQATKQATFYGDYDYDLLSNGIICAKGPKNQRKTSGENDFNSISPQRSYLYMSYATYNMTIDIDDGYYICMALETSDNVWVSKKIFLWISICYWDSKKNFWPENWTPRWLNTGPPVSPTGTDAPVWVVRTPTDWSRFLCTTKPVWGPRSQRDWPHTWDPELTPTHQPLA